jgi:phytoene dehydrogenase-like protein
MPVTRTALVVGSGPNGLAAAVALARAGFDVTVHEAAARIGGGTRTDALTLAGFLHDRCSAIHPMAAASPFLRSLPLAAHGLEWIQPPVLLAHPFDDGSAALLLRSQQETALGLGADAKRWTALLEPFVDEWTALFNEALAPPLHIPRHPLLLARFARHALQPATRLTRNRFEGHAARALLLGIAAHRPLPVDSMASAAFGLMLAVAGHAVGWPLARGGSSTIADALAADLVQHGGHIVTTSRIRELPASGDDNAVLLDLTPRQIRELAGDRLGSYGRRLARYRYGVGVFKIDWALSGPVPWIAEGCRQAGTVHLGGGPDEVTSVARAPWNGVHAERPFILFTQPSLFDRSRAPDGTHTAWAYCHVPNGSRRDMTERIERQVERFAPGFRDLILARHTADTAALEQANANLVGGDINGGMQDLRQLIFRPLPRRDPYTTPVRGLFICSASTPPGGGVHGMCGWHASRSVLRHGN